MSLGTDRGIIMSTELLGVAERAQHDLEARRPTSRRCYSGSGSGRGRQRAVCPGRLVTVPPSPDASRGSTTRLSDGYAF